jgi:hypothetical protein
MEDASAEDLDWFWRGWFFSTDVTDISLDSVKYAKADFSPVSSNQVLLNDTSVKVPLPKPQVNAFEDISKIRNRESGAKFLTDVDTSLRDFYWKYDRGIEPYDSSRYTVAFNATAEPLDEATKERLKNKHFYELSFGNKGGLVMPIIIEWTFKDGTKEIDRIPAQVWRHNENKVTKFFMKDKEVTNIKLDPMRETADINEGNNTWGGVVAEPSRVQLYKQKQAAARGQSTGPNPMQKSKEKKGF